MELLKKIAIFAWIPALVVSVVSCSFTMVNYNLQKALATPQIVFLDTNVVAENFITVYYDLKNVGREPAVELQTVVVDIASGKALGEHKAQEPIYGGDTKNEHIVLDDNPTSLGDLEFCVSWKGGFTSHAYSYAWHSKDNKWSANDPNGGGQSSGLYHVDESRLCGPR